MVRDTRLPIICGRATAWRLIREDQARHQNTHNMKRSLNLIGWWLSTIVISGVILFI